jgi:hypothetical protein
MMEQIPLLEELRSEVVRLLAAAGGEGNDSEILSQLSKLEKALQFLLAVVNWASDKVAYPQRLQQRLRELGLK